jgi:hypothetical protein
MKPPRLLIIVFCGVVAVYLLAAFAYRKGYDEGVAHERSTAGNTQVDWHGSRAQIEDAMRRWAPKGIGGQRTPAQMLAEVHQHYWPRVMAFPTKNCIQLMLEPGAVGGEPIYCYRANSLDLVEEYSDVE